MDFSHYNRDTAFGLRETSEGEIDLTIYLGGDNVKEFSILTGGDADIVRLKQLIKGARLESDHIAGSDKKESIASKVLSDAGICCAEISADEQSDLSTIISKVDGACGDNGNIRIWLNPGEEIGISLTDELEKTNNMAGDNGSTRNSAEGKAHDIERIELIMDADGAAKRLEDDTRLHSVKLVAYSHYGYDNNYTRAHEETEFILEQMIAIAKKKAAVKKGDFEITVESIVKQGQGDRPGVIVDPEEQTFGAVYSYSVKKGELCISELNCDMPDGDIFSCGSCGKEISFCGIKSQLKAIAEEVLTCPFCGAHISAGKLRRGLHNAEYFYRKRDLMPVYIIQDDADCIGFLGNDCSEERIEQYLKLAIENKSHNCIASFLEYKKKHLKKEAEDIFVELELDFDDEAEETGTKDNIISDDGELSFGHYGRDKSPIVWEVLSTVDNEALIITKECIDSKNYNASYEKTTWETSSIRKWLNEEFIKTAFTEDEREHILETPLRNPDNYFNRVNGGNDTKDKVFLLNIDEAEFYFDDRFKRQALAGKEALGKRAYVAGTGYTAWWLRTPGSDEVHASNVDYYGTAVNIGFLVNYTSNCIRPAMWIKI